MEKRVIAVDFDDVLMPFYEGLLAYYNQKYSAAIKYDDLFSYYLEDVLKCDPAFVGTLITDFYISPEHASIAPLFGAYETLLELRDAYHLDIITSRPKTAQIPTEAWLSQNFPDIFREVHFLNSFHVNALLADTTQRKRSKAEMCKEIGASLLIDDHEKHALDVAESGLPVLLPNKPWNQRISHPNVIRVKDWPEMASWIRLNLGRDTAPLAAAS